MKKGCFIAGIISLTICLLIVFYGIKYYSDDILEIGKVKTLSLLKYKINSDLEKVTASAYSDSLNAEIENYLDRIDTMEFNENTIDNFGEVADAVEAVLADSTVAPGEFHFIKKLLESNERRKTY